MPSDLMKAGQFAPHKAIDQEEVVIIPILYSLCATTSMSLLCTPGTDPCYARLFHDSPCAADGFFIPGKEIFQLLFSANSLSISGIEHVGRFNFTPYGLGAPVHDFFRTLSLPGGQLKRFKDARQSLGRCRNSGCETRPF
jgi:hypothetical protein